MRLLVELVYDPGCPHVDAARDVLTTALRDNGAATVWTEWSSDDPGLPEHADGLGSPTILVNGKDVVPGPRPWSPRGVADGPRCRVYRDEAGRPRGAPPLAEVTRAILEAVGPDVV